MKIYVMARAYNCYGSHTTLAPIGDFLLRGGADFGEAIKELTVTLYFRSSGPPKHGFETLLVSHNRELENLPKIVFRRAKGKIEIGVASELMDGRDWKRSPRLSLPLFERGVEEVIAALALLKKKLKASDAFALGEFLTHCDAARTGIPASEDALQELAGELKAEEQARRESMSPWELLGIDWGDFHPQAREILNDPFFWSSSHEFSPNGNDTGADLLADYRQWLKAAEGGQPIRFLERQAKRWGYSSLEVMDDEVQDEAAIGLAFADIKMRGICDGQLRTYALKAVERQRLQAEAATGWKHREERLQALEKIEQKLQVTNQPE